MTEWKLYESQHEFMMEPPKTGLRYRLVPGDLVSFDWHTCRLHRQGAEFLYRSFRACIGIGWVAPSGSREVWRRKDQPDQELPMLTDEVTQELYKEWHRGVSLEQLARRHKVTVRYCEWVVKGFKPLVTM